MRTTCPSCGTEYEAASTEIASDPGRRCLPCFLSWPENDDENERAFAALLEAPHEPDLDDDDDDYFERLTEDYDDG